VYPQFSTITKNSFLKMETKNYIYFYILNCKIILKNIWPVKYLYIHSFFKINHINALEASFLFYINFSKKLYQDIFKKNLFVFFL